MGYDNYPSVDQAQGDKPLLSIVEAAILEGDARPVEHPFGVLKIQTMLGEVAAILRFVLLIHHPRM